MAVSFPLDLPAGAPVSSRITARSVVAVSKSPFTGEQQTYVHPGQWWEAEFSLPPMLREKAEAWLAFLVKLNGQEGTFLMGDPDAKTPRGAAGGTPLVNGASQTGNELATKGWTTSITGILKVGDYIQLGTGALSRLHKVLDDADSDGAGNATLNLWPNLRYSPLDNDPLVVNAARSVFRLKDNDRGWDSDKFRRYSISFSAVEAL